MSGRFALGWLGWPNCCSFVRSFVRSFVCLSVCTRNLASRTVSSPFGRWPVCVRLGRVGLGLVRSCVPPAFVHTVPDFRPPPLFCRVPLLSRCATQPSLGCQFARPLTLPVVSARHKFTRAVVAGDSACLVWGILVCNRHAAHRTVAEFAWQRKVFGARWLKRLRAHCCVVVEAFSQ